MRIIFFILLFTIFVSFSQYLLSLFTKKK
jgi:hypothetical protein